MARHRKGKRPRPPLVERVTDMPDHPIVTEHAMLRWLERVHGVNLQLIVDEVLAEGRAGMIYLLESGRIPVSDGVRLVIKNRRVVTVLN